MKLVCWRNLRFSQLFFGLMKLIGVFWPLWLEKLLCVTLFSFEAFKRIVSRRLAPCFLAQLGGASQLWFSSLMFDRSLHRRSNLCLGLNLDLILPRLIWMLTTLHIFFFLCFLEDINFTGWLIRIYFLGQLHRSARLWFVVVPSWWAWLVVNTSWISLNGFLSWNWARAEKTLGSQAISVFGDLLRCCFLVLLNCWRALITELDHIWRSVFIFWFG